MNAKIIAIAVCFLTVPAVFASVGEVIDTAYREIIILWGRNNDIIYPKGLSMIEWMIKGKGWLVYTV